VKIGAVLSTIPNKLYDILGLLEIVRKGTVRFVMPVCLYVYQSVRPSAWNNSILTRRIFKKFDIGMFFLLQIVSRTFKFN
jgi:hypothetical protein